MSRLKSSFARNVLCANGHFLAGAVSQLPFSAGDVISVRDGQRIEVHRALLLRGAVARLLQHEDGRSVCLGIVRGPALLEHATKTTFEALGDIAYASSHVSERWRLSGDYASAREREAQDWMRGLLFDVAQQRIARFLLTVARAYPQFRELPPRLTYPRLGALCGVTSRSVERSLRTLIDQKVLSRNCSRYTVIDMTYLAQLAGAARTAPLSVFGVPVVDRVGEV